jgi:hypothetical protein
MIRAILQAIKAIFTLRSDEIFCPVCGYYCLGRGGKGCIDKPKLQGEKHDNKL